jgi:hypothetical protein
MRTSKYKNQNLDTENPDYFGTNVGETILERVSQEAMPQRELTLPRNLGNAERCIRMSAGTGLIAAAVLAPLSRGWRITLAAVGVTELTTGASGYCPLWQALGINTRR